MSTYVHTWQVYEEIDDGIIYIGTYINFSDEWNVRDGNL